MPETLYSVVLIYDGNNHNVHQFSDYDSLFESTFKRIISRGENRFPRMKKLWQSSDKVRMDRLAEIVINHINLHNNGIDEKVLEKETVKLGFR